MSTDYDQNDAELIDNAVKAKKNAHCRYSDFPVGCALRTKSGKIVTGCNVENAAYPLSTCAERVAITKAISQSVVDGDREIVAIAVATKLTDKFPSPCGGCRQIIAEFGYNSNCRVIMIKDSPSPPHVVKIMTIAELLPEAFLPDALNK